MKGTKSQKKILLVVTKSFFGGAQRYVYDLATILAADGYTVAVASGGTTGGLIDKLQAANIPHYPIGGLQRNISLYKELQSAYSLATIIRDYDPDVIHLNSSKAGGIGACIARLLGVPRIIFTAHGWPFHERRGWLWRKLAWLASWITVLLAHDTIVVSNFDRANAHMGRLDRKLHLIHNGIADTVHLSRAVARTALFTPATLQDHQSDFWLHTIAELHPNKNLATAIKAVATHNQNPAPTQKIFYTIASTGDEHDKLIQLINELEAADHIKLLGYVDQAAQYLKAFDAFMLISHKEGLPYVVLEAVQAGLPVIGSNVGGIPDVLENADCHQLVSPHDIPMVVDGITAVKTTPTQSIQLPDTFTLATMTKATELVYKQTNPKKGVNVA